MLRGIYNLVFIGGFAVLALFGAFVCDDSAYAGGRPDYDKYSKQLTGSAREKFEQTQQEQVFSPAPIPEKPAKTLTNSLDSDKYVTHKYLSGLQKDYFQENRKLHNEMSSMRMAMDSVNSFLASRELYHEQEDESFWTTLQYSGLGLAIMTALSFFVKTWLAAMTTSIAEWVIKWFTSQRRVHHRKKIRRKKAREQKQ